MKKSEDDKNKKNASYFGGHFGFLAISAQEYRRGGDYRARPDSEGIGDRQRSCIEESSIYPQNCLQTQSFTLFCLCHSIPIFYQILDPIHC